jgi:hypothetical protein
MQTYQIKLTGTQPLLMHSDNIEWADEMGKWRDDRDNKKTSKAGDDRSPAWRWLGRLYHDGKQVIMPIANTMRCLMEGGAMVPVPGAKHGKTFKSQTQSGIMPTEIGWPLLIDGKPVDYAALSKLAGQKDFEKHQAARAGCRLRAPHQARKDRRIQAHPCAAEVRPVDGDRRARCC